MLKFIAKFLVPSKIANGFSSAKNFLSGKKTYLTATILLLQAIIMGIEQISAMQGITEIYSWATNFQDNQVLKMILESFAIFGIRAAISK